MLERLAERLRAEIRAVAQRRRQLPRAPLLNQFARRRSRDEQLDGGKAPRVVVAGNGADFSFDVSCFEVLGSMPAC